MNRIACIYTGMGSLTNIVEDKINKAVSNVKYNHILDSGIMRDIIEDGRIKEETESRILHLFASAVEINPDLILCTCSSIGEIAEKAAELHPTVKIIRIDDAMAEYAVNNYSRIGIMATLETTLGPSCRLLERKAKLLGKTLDLKYAVAQKAFELTKAGKKEEAYENLKNTADSICKDGEILLLAQASMAEFSGKLENDLGIPVLGSAEICAERIGEFFKNN